MNSTRSQDENSFTLYNVFGIDLPLAFSSVSNWQQKGLLSFTQVRGRGVIIIIRHLSDRLDNIIF